MKFKSLPKVLVALFVTSILSIAFYSCKEEAIPKQEIEQQHRIPSKALNFYFLFIIFFFIVLNASLVYDGCVNSDDSLYETLFWKLHDTWVFYARRSFVDERIFILSDLS